jgi:hypothetical protein
MICPQNLPLSYLIIIIILISHLTHTTTSQTLNMITDSVRLSDYYRFYEDNNQNGLKYDVTLDRAIFDILNNEKDSLNNSELKSKVENYIGHNVAFTTFQTHLNILVSHKILNRNDTGRGKEVLYSLTGGAKNLLKLNLLKQSSLDEILCRRIFEKLFFYFLHHPPAKTISSEDEFNRFLESEVNLSGKDLNWGLTSTGSNYEFVDILYGTGQRRDGSNYGGLLTPSKTLSEKQGSRLPQRIREYWKTRRRQSKVQENIEFICLPISGNIDFLITKTEHWEINKPSRINKYTADSYLITMPGVSVSELIKVNNLCSICKDFEGQAMVSMNLLMKSNINSNYSNSLGTAMKFEHNDIENAFALLMKNGLIKTASDFHGDETRYILADGRLRDFIEALRNIHEREFDLLFHKWSLFEGPNKDDQSRINRLLGENEARKVFKDIEMSRYQHRIMMRKCKDVEEYNQCLKKIYSANDDPDWKRYSSDSYFDRMLRAYKETRKRVPASKKDLRKDVIKYDEYLKRAIEVELEDLFHDPDSEGVDYIWLIHGLTIQKYEFLQDIIRVICPRIIEVAEDEARLSKIEKDRLEINPGWEGKQPKLSESLSIYVHDQPSLISASIIDDPIAKGRQRERKIPDITSYMWKHKR